MAPAHINPIVPGFAPDPSICRVGDTFYLANSSFHFFPGLPIYASKDLVEWTIIGNAINRKDQLSVAHTGVRICPQANGVPLLAAGGLHAPTIRYHDGTFYILCTNVTHLERPEKALSFENFVITTKDVWGDDWSDPVYIDLYGFDPSIFFDDDGKVYIQGTEEPGPNLKIIQYEVDLSTGKMLSEKKVIFNGVSGYYPEGPHMYKKDGWYYLLIAEGGTHATHSVNIARSRNIWGPYMSFEQNPILTARGTSSYIQHVGHADLVQDDGGNWWGVFLGVRRAGDRYVLGRETFLTACTWPEGGWPSLDQASMDIPALLEPRRPLSPLPSPKTKTSDFLFIRHGDRDVVQIEEGGSGITVTARSLDFPSMEAGIAFAGKRQRQLQGTSSVQMNTAVEHKNTCTQAGLAYYKDELRYARVYLDFASSGVITEIVNSADSIRRVSTQKVQLKDSVGFRLTYTEESYEFAFRVDGEDSGWTPTGRFDSLEMTAFDFGGPVIGVFALGSAEGVQVGFQHLEVA